MYSADIDTRWRHYHCFLSIPHNSTCPIWRRPCLPQWYRTGLFVLFGIHSCHQSRSGLLIISSSYNPWTFVRGPNFGVQKLWWRSWNKPAKFLWLSWLEWVISERKYNHWFIVITAGWPLYQWKIKTNLNQIMLLMFKQIKWVFFVIANNFVKRTPTLVVRELSFEPKLADNFENDRLFQITITEWAAYEDLLV